MATNPDDTPDDVREIPEDRLLAVVGDPSLGDRTRLVVATLLRQMREIRDRGGAPRCRLRRDGTAFVVDGVEESGR